jgi:DNA-directed RNA polymerase subunit alpha
MTNFSIKSQESNLVDSGALYNQFVFDELTPGQGITIGNVLRRTLLADLGGTAIIAVRILGVCHEFSTIEGVREDVLEILLNLKGIILKTIDNKDQFNIIDSTNPIGRLRVQGPGIVTADLIELPIGLELINPNHYIATLSHSNIIEMEFLFQSGVGYDLASNREKVKEKLDGFLEIDAIFMPVEKVNFRVENSYSNSKHINDQLILDIWTNGSLTPLDALLNASKIIKHLLSSLITNIANTNSSLVTTEFSKLKQLESTKSTLETFTNISIEELQLSVRSYNCLKFAQINSISDLLKYSPEQLQLIKNLGQKSANEIFVTLKNKFGITLN